MCEVIDAQVIDAHTKEAEKLAEEYKKQKTLCINILGSPGSGKTTFISALSKEITELLVIQADPESDIDTKTLRAQGIKTHQINTHSGCHLTPHQIIHAIENKTLPSYLIIENVGNLVCPAGVPLGQHINLVISSTPEGHDKPEKYPHIFHHADVVVISKDDLKEMVEFNKEEFKASVKKRSPNVKIFSWDKKKPVTEIITYIKDSWNNNYA